MRRGDVVDDRFEIELLAGSGGMGAIYRARDRKTGELVALKMIRGDAADLDERFAQEARMLSETHHPAVVRYVTHGITSDGDAFLVMEWLEGETLSQRLKRGGLELGEALIAARRAASALAAVHARGVIHRDIKPGNIFLPNKDPAQTKIIDFGLAREAELSMGTRTGIILGTPGYLSPEQARGKKPIGPAADVFSLGCVLYRCVVGRAPFEGDDAVAVLAKLVFEDPPRARDVSPDVPRELDEVLARMMAKDPKERIPDGAAALRALAAITVGSAAASAAPPSVATGQSAPPSRASTGITLAEERIVNVVLAAATPDDPSSAALFSSGEAWAKIVHAIRPFGVELAALPDGSLVATLSGSDPIDQAVRAARCALVLRQSLPARTVVLATGRRAPSDTAALGRVIDRAVAMARSAVVRAPANAVRVDEVTAGTLERYFEVVGAGASRMLLREREPSEAWPRMLLGKPTRLVGRERELEILTSLWKQCVDGPAARAVIITGPSGVGKSRLRHELLREARAATEPRPVVWTARSDPMRAGSPFGMMAELVRRAIARGDLPARLAQHLGTTEGARVAVFLGELCGAHMTGAVVPALAAARRDTALMGEQFRRAFEDLLRVELAERPLLVVLEDLQWGDLPTVQTLGDAVRTFPDRPLFVLALARPEMNEVFPNLWADRGAQRLDLGELGPEASETLVRQALGDDTPAAVVRAIVERAAGNAFFLEEMIRARKEGRAEVPETVLAVVEARMERLEPDARLVLRAASVFGTTFWKGGVAELLGEASNPVRCDQWLPELERRELIKRRSDSHFADEEEYAFLQAPLRDAAYTMLTDDDEGLGHRLAGEWLERKGERDAPTLAEHFERGGERARAAIWYLEAAERALKGNDFHSAEALAGRGINCGAKNELLGALHLVLAEAERCTGKNVEAHRDAFEAARLLARGGARWLHAAAELGQTSAKIGRYDQLMTVVEELRGMEAEGAEHAIAAARIATQIFYAGRADLAELLLARAERAAEALSSPEPLVLAYVARARAARAVIAGDVLAYVTLMREAAEGFERAGALRSAMTQRANVAHGYVQLGAYAMAESALRELLGAAERMGYQSMIDDLGPLFGLALLGVGAIDEARARAQAASEAAARKQAPRVQAHAHICLARIAIASGDLDAAEREARAAVAVTGSPPDVRVYAKGMLGLVLVRRGRAAEGRGYTQEAVTLLELLKGAEEGATLVRLAHVEALAALDPTAARGALASARAHLLARAAKISDPAWRTSFLQRVPENAHTLAMAEAWLGPSA